MWNIHDPSCGPLNQPDFEADPGAYFDWFEHCSSGPAGPSGDGTGPQPPCEPRTWITGGRCFELVCTPHGPEIRPCFEKPIPTVSTSATITALRLTGHEYIAHVATSKGVRIVKILPGEIKLSQLVSALLHRSELPGVNFRRIPEEFWMRQKKIVIRQH